MTSIIQAAVTVPSAACSHLNAAHKAGATSGRTSFASFQGLRFSVAAQRRRALTPLHFAKATRRTGTVCEKSKPASVEVKSHDSHTGAGIVDTKSFDELVVKSPLPVLVDFWAPWCGPCRMIAPIIDELSKTYAGRLTCLKMNTDECSDVASKFGIRSIPTVMIFKGGQKVDTVIGAVPKSTLISMIDKHIIS